MGYRPSADLVYGIVPRPQDDWSESQADDHGDWDDLALHLAGIPKPDYNQVPEGSTYYDELKTALAKAPIIYGDWGDGENDSHALYLGIRASHQNADWDAPHEIDPQTLNPGPNTLHEWDRQIHDACTQLEIPYYQPRWFLLCSYG